MRWDRFFTLAAARPLARPMFARLPVLMYHSISDDPETGVNPYFKVCTSPARFADQMQWLADAGWRGVTLSEGLAALNAPAAQSSIRNAPSSTARNARLVVLTFDDGFKDFHSAAWPVLQQHGFTATMYLPSAFIGFKTRQFNGRNCLTWPEIDEMRRAGMEFGSHTVNHPRLVELRWPQIESELRDSRAELEQNIGCAMPHFAYPYGFPQAEKSFVRNLRQRMIDAGYSTNVTTIAGCTRVDHDPYLIPRLPANNDDDRSLFEAKLAGAYDWLGYSQFLTKQFARWVHPNRRPVAS